MTDTPIPEDIMQAAEEALDKLLCNDIEASGDAEAFRRDCITDIAKAILAERQRSQWQPIETAPKDATILLATNRDEDGETWSYVSQGRWIDGEDDQVDQPGHDAGFVDCEYLCFFPGRSFGSETSRYAGTQPTHWMPLPSAPKGGE